MELKTFRSALEFRAWLESHHSATPELWLRLRKTGAAGPGVTYAEALELALCFGWIDGVRRGVDRGSFAIRFTPRRPRSIWSRVNLRHYARLARTGLVAPAGQTAYRQRDPRRSGLYSFESRPRTLPPALQRIFRAQRAAWEFFAAQPPSYRRTAIFWVVSAKQGATRERRLAQLIADSAAGRRIRLLARPGRRRSERRSGRERPGVDR